MFNRNPPGKTVKMTSQNLKQKKRYYTIICIILVLVVCIACNSKPQNKTEKESMTPVRDVNTVKETHTPELMKIKGVVGVYVGATDDGAPFIGVMVVKKSRNSRKKSLQSWKTTPC